MNRKRKRWYKVTLNDNKHPFGFTALELVIVILIIALLIGGVLRGEELIKDQKINATINQIRSYELAVQQFQDEYNALPGDLANARETLSNCMEGLDCSGGQQAIKGNGVLSDSIDGLGQSLVVERALSADDEIVLFWNHLATDERIGGISTAPISTPSFGNGLPIAEIGGGIMVGYWTGAGTDGLLAQGGWTQLPSGHYFSLRRTADAVSATNTSLTPNEAARFDRRMDDGNPATGRVRAAGSPNCVRLIGKNTLRDNFDYGFQPDEFSDEKTSLIAVYNEQSDETSCALYIRASF